MGRFTLLLAAYFIAQTSAAQTLQSVTTPNNTTTNAVRILGDANAGSSGAGELFLGLFNSNKVNDTRTFIGWKNTGNTITDGVAGTLLLQGRSDLAAPIDFATGIGTPLLRMRVSGDGKIGIGMSAPAALLHLKSLGNTNLTSAFLIQNNSNTEIFRILDNGNLGLGTATPVSRLHLNGGGTPTTAPIINIQNYIGTGLLGSLRFTSGWNSFDNWSGIEAHATGGLDQQDLRFFTSYGTRYERMRVDEFGSVGIGTTGPLAKLDVNGNIFCRAKLYIGVGLPPADVLTKITNYELAVNGRAIFNNAKVMLYGTPWPDYVFEEDYKLLTLQEVESYIKTYKHLPELISAEQAEKEGIDIGATQTTLLKKIEELTIYLIEINKKILALENENKLLKKVR